MKRTLTICVAALVAALFYASLSRRSDAPAPESLHDAAQAAHTSATLVAPEVVALPVDERREAPAAWSAGEGDNFDELYGGLELDELMLEFEALAAERDRHGRAAREILESVPPVVLIKDTPWTEYRTRRKALKEAGQLPVEALYDETEGSESGTFTFGYRPVARDHYPELARHLRLLSWFQVRAGELRRAQHEQHVQAQVEALGWAR